MLFNKDTAVPMLQTTFMSAPAGEVNVESPSLVLEPAAAASFTLPAAHATVAIDAALALAAQGPLRSDCSGSQSKAPATVAASRAAAPEVQRIERLAVSKQPCGVDMSSSDGGPSGKALRAALPSAK